MITARFYSKDGTKLSEERFGDRTSFIKVVNSVRVSMRLNNAVRAVIKQGRFHLVTLDWYDFILDSALKGWKTRRVNSLTQAVEQGDLF